MDQIRLLFQHFSPYEKYIAAAIFVTALLSALILAQGCALLCDRLREKKTGGWLKAVLAVLFTAVLSVCFFHSWISAYTPAGAESDDALLSTSAVVVRKTEYGYFFDGWGSGDAMIFYGEENIEEKAYAPLLMKCAVQGLDCFLVEMPYHRHCLNVNAADEILSAHDYYRWYMGAHGSAVTSAESYALAHPESVRGLILFGACPEEPLAEDMELIAVYAENDGLFDWEAYEKYASSFPENTREAVIQGGNHAGFGCYGDVSGDGPAEISAELQQQLAAEMVRLALIRAD